MSPVYELVHGVWPGEWPRMAGSKLLCFFASTSIEKLVINPWSLFLQFWGISHVPDLGVCDYPEGWKTGFLCTYYFFSCSVQFSRLVVSNSLQPREPQHARPLVHHQLLEFTQTHVHWVSDAIQPSLPLSSPSPLAFNLSQHQGLFQWVSSLHQVAKVLEFQLQHQSSNEYSGLISFRIDWFDLLAVQGTLKSLLQNHSSKASILRHLAFFIVQLSHPYMTTGKTIALTRRTSLGKCLCFLICCLGWS